MRSAAAPGEPAAEPEHSDAEPDPDPSIDLPFSIEPGMGLALGGQFFATALRHEPRGSVALLAQLGGSAGSRVIELGRLEGDVPPPRLAADGADLLVALEDTLGAAAHAAAAHLASTHGTAVHEASTHEASTREAANVSYRVRVARLPRADLSAPLQWQEGPRASRDESNAFDFAVASRAPGGSASGGSLFAWDDWPAGESHGRVFVMSLGADGAASAARAASSPNVDAAEPRLVARPGGYWLAWLVDAASEAGRARVYDPGEAEAAAPGRAEPGAGGGAGASAAPAAGGSLAAAGPSAAKSAPAASGPNGARGIEVIALDAAGQPAGNVRRIRTESARVVGYDLTTNGAGNAWLVWRQDAPSAGAAGGRVLVAEVQSDGPHEILPVREEDVGSGEPSWLGSAALAAAANESPWLTFPDQRDRTLLLPIDYPRPVPEPLQLAPDLQGAAALAAVFSGALAGQVLFALPKGRALELFSAACQR